MDKAAGFTWNRWPESVEYTAFACEQEKPPVSSSDVIKPGTLFTISGEVIFPKDADIYLLLKTQAEEEKGETTPSSRTLIIRLDPEQKKAKRASFEFVGVPKRSYCIRAFLDMDKNGKFTSAGSHAGFDKEPFGLYKPAFPETWDLIRFEVDKNITGIKIELRFWGI